jgi:Na+/serine symporter
MTPDEHHMLETIYGGLFDLATTPPAAGGAIGSAVLQAVNKDTAAQLAKLPDAIAAAVVAALPASGAGGLTEQQVTDAVKAAMRQGTG